MLHLQPVWHEHILELQSLLCGFLPSQEKRDKQLKDNNMYTMHFFMMTS